MDDRQGGSEYEGGTMTADTRNQRDMSRFWRLLVFQRDGGICAECGRDCEQLRKALLLLPKKEREQTRKKLGIPKHLHSLWQCHHIKSLEEGGITELANLRTLCVVCHIRETSQQNRRYGNPATPSELQEVFG
jgi:5-methylcytosine-specific restriction endonuclease McrA